MLTSATSCALLLALTALAWPRSAVAIDLAPGDILVSDTNLNALIRVDPRTGDRTIIASNQLGTGDKFAFPLEMQFPGDVITYRGWVARKYEAGGERRVDIELEFRRDDALLGLGWATFDVP